MDQSTKTFNDEQSFLNSFLTPEQNNSTAPKEKEEEIEAPFQSFYNQQKKSTTDAASEEKSTDTDQVNENKVTDVNEELKKFSGTEDKANSSTLVTDFAKFSEKLLEKDLLTYYEDGSLPQSEEEFIDALAQTTDLKISSTIEQAWQEKINNLSPSLQLIHQYAEMGIQSAEELAPFINTVQQAEAINNLDVQNVNDQEQIVLIQLLNTGMDEQSALEEIADLKERDKLASRAEQYFPTIQRAYEDNIRQSLLQREQEEEQYEQYINTNATNVSYFLDKEIDYLPFKLDNRDRALKAQVFELAGQPIDRTKDGEPVFGWQKYIESLQYGDENAYKEFMNIMVFMADKNKYHKNINKVTSNTVNTNTFKKIQAASNKATNTISQEQSNGNVFSTSGKDAWSI